MKYIGIDLHRRFSQICVYDAEATEEKIYRLDNDKLVLEDFLCLRTQFKNVIRSILAKFNINLERTNLWSGQGRDLLEETISPAARGELTRLALPSPYCETIKQCLAHIDSLTEQIKYWEGEALCELCGFGAP